jgi:UDP-N-acetylmuramate-alanine ligase
MKIEAKHIHLIGICGTAMASLAGMLQLQGHTVTGSDAAAYPPMSDLLETLGIRVMEPYAEKNLEPRPDLVIVGNAISRGNVELEYVLDQRIPFRSMAQTVYEEFLTGRESLIVAGTHGKTTTTSMLAWIYETAARMRVEHGPSFLIGRVVAFDGSANVSECVARAFCKVERYGFSEGSEWQMRDLTHRDGRTHWQVWREGKPWLELSLPMAGEHNALNATAAAALAAGQGIDDEAIVDALGSFKSVKRRLEVRAIERGVTVIDDFAHHPTAIRETLRALRSAYPQSRLWAVLEPRSNTLRRNVFERELVDALGLADEVVLAGVFKQESIPEGERLHPEAVVRALLAQGRPAMLAANVEEIVAHVAADARAGDVVAILSNGGFDGIYEKLPARLAGPAALSPVAKTAALPLAQA